MIEVMIECPCCGTRHARSSGACPGCGFAPASIEGFDAWAPDLAHEGDGFEAKYFDTLAELEDANFWFRARNALIVWALGRYFPGASDLLEIGCGTGYVLRGVSEAFPDMRLTGTELFVGGLSHAVTRVPGARFEQMDARAIPYRDAFDVVAAFDVIEHIADDEGVLANLFQAVRPGGGLMVAVPQHMWLWSETDVAARHERRYSRSELVAKVGRAGFEPLRVTSFVSLLLPLMVLARWRRGPRSDVASELRIAGPLNAALESVLGLERALIRRGVGFPAGGSLLLVARRPSGATA